MATEGKQKQVPLIRRMLTARGRSLEITTAGWLFILLTLAVGFAAINSGANLLHVIFGIQLGLIVASGVLSENMVRRAQARRLPTSALHAQTPGALRVELRAREGRGELLALSVEDDDRIEDAGECGAVFALSVPSGETLEMHSTVVMPRRGRHRPRSDEV